MSAVLFDIADGIARPTLNRPERLNALTRPIIAKVSPRFWRNAHPALPGDECFSSPA